MPDHLPEEAVIATAKRRHPLLSQYKPDDLRVALGEARLDLEAAAPEIRAAAVEEAAVDDCESCEGGIYYEGDEWTPCQECEHGKVLAEHFRTARREAVEEERERLRVDAEDLDAAADEYRMALGLIRDLLKDAERIYEPGHEDAPHIAAARDLTEHEGAIAEIEKAAAALDQEDDRGNA